MIKRVELRGGREVWRVSVPAGYRDVRGIYQYYNGTVSSESEALLLEGEYKRRAEGIRVSRREEARRRLEVESIGGSAYLLSEAFLLFEDRVGESVSLRRVQDRRRWEDFCSWYRDQYPGRVSLGDVRIEDAEDYVNFLRSHGSYSHWRLKGDRVSLSADTINGYISTCRMVFRHLKRIAGLTFNPFGEITKLRAEHAEREAFSLEEVERLLSKADAFMRPLILLAVKTGLSEGDCCTLRWSDINFGERHIYRVRNKTAWHGSRACRIPMLPAVESLLLELRSKSGADPEYVLPAQAEVYQRCKALISQRMKKLLLECGIESAIKVGKRSRLQSVKDFHSLRHTFCVNAAQAGIPLAVVQEIVGHMTSRMTELYSRHSTKDDRLRWIGRLSVNGMDSKRSELLSKLSSMPTSKLSELVGIVDGVGIVETRGNTNASGTATAEADRSESGRDIVHDSPESWIIRADGTCVTLYPWSAKGGATAISGVTS